MPPHLEWVDLSDFTAGLWNVGSWLVPQDGAQLLEDCVPQPQGGLRAFFSKGTLTVAGLGVGVDEVCIGVISRGGIAHRTTAGQEASDHYIATFDRDNNVARIYRLDATADDTSWSVIKTMNAADTGTPEPVFFAIYTTVDDDTNIYFTYQAVGSTDVGMWRILYDTGGVTKISLPDDEVPSYLTVHQNRLVVSTLEQNGARIRWSNPGSDTFEAGSFLDIEPHRRLTRTAFLVPFAPNDLVVAKEGAAWTLVQDALDDPIVRTMADHHYPGRLMIPANTGDGVIFADQVDGAWSTQQGSSFQHVSPQLTSGSVSRAAPGVSGRGSFTAVGRYVFTPAGFVLDTSTGAWFTVSTLGLSDQAPFGTYDAAIAERRLYLPKSDLSEIITYQPGIGDRVPTYRYRSAPLSLSDGRQIVIREVQVTLEAHNTGASVSVTVNGTTHSVTGLSAGRQKVSLIFHEWGEVLDVTVQPNSNSSDEAPTINSIRVGVLPGRRTLP